MLKHFVLFCAVICSNEIENGSIWRQMKPGYLLRDHQATSPSPNHLLQRHHIDYAIRNHPRPARPMPTLMIQTMNFSKKAPAFLRDMSIYGCFILIFSYQQYCLYRTACPRECNNRAIPPCKYARKHRQD